MKRHEWWIYQERKTESPWAIHLFASKSYRRIRADSEIYADWIPNISKRMIIGEVSIVKPDFWIDLIGQICQQFGHPLDDQDRKQLEDEINEVKLAFKR